MKHTTIKALALMAALAAGSAMAATTAGTTITNQATATYDEDGGDPNKSTSSNIVTTTVQAVPSFTITDNTGSTNNAKTARPGDYVVYQYTLTNTGNVNSDNYVISNVPITTPAAYATATDATGVRFSLTDPNTDSTAGISAAEYGAMSSNATLNVSGVNAGGTRTFYMVYQIPLTATNSATYDSNPSGERQANTSIPNSVVDPTASALLTDSDNANITTVARNDSGLIGPRFDADANGAVDGNAPSGSTYGAYTSASNGSVTITPSGDEQTSTPALTSATVITFEQRVLNTGNRDAYFDLAATLSGFTNGSSAPVVQFYSDAALTTLITQTNTLTADPDGAGSSLGGAQSVWVKVTLNGATATSPTTLPSITVRATSQYATANSGDTTTDKINLPGVRFADNVGGVLQNDIVNRDVTPSSSTEYVTFPMIVRNTGTTTDTFNLSGSVPSLPGAVVTYYKASDTGFTTPITATDPINAGDLFNVVARVSVPANSVQGTYTLNQSATSPTTGGTGATASDTNDTVTVKGTGGLDMTTGNNNGNGKFVVNCGASSTCADPTTTGAEAKPGDYLRYTIKAQNKRNSTLSKVVITDDLNNNLEFVSASARLLNASNAPVTANFAYRHAADGTNMTTFSGAWSSTLSGVADGGILQVALDNGAVTNSIQTDDKLSIDFTIEITIIVKVK